MTDIVERLRFRADENYEMLGNIHEPLLEAADEIEKLRAALRPFAEAARKYDPDEGDGDLPVWDWSPTTGMLRKARAALEEK